MKMPKPSPSKIASRHLMKTGGLKFSSKEAEIWWHNGLFYVEFVWRYDASSFNARFMQGLESMMEKECLGLAKEWASDALGGKPQVEASWSTPAGNSELLSRMRISLRSPGLMEDDPSLGPVVMTWFKRRGYKPSLV